MITSYRVCFKKSAEKELRTVPKKELSVLIERIGRLSSDPRPSQHTKLVGSERYRIRQGDWRSVYSIDDAEKTVTIVKIGHRREVYRQRS